MTAFPNKFDGTCRNCGARVLALSSHKQVPPGRPNQPNDGLCRGVINDVWL